MGFTLIELLLVVGIIALLAGIVVYAVNPTKQVTAARDADRLSQVKQVQSAVDQFFIDRGIVPAESFLPPLSEIAIAICRRGFVGTDSTCVNLESSLVPTYLPVLPHDVTEPCPNYSGYRIYKEGSKPRVSSYFLGRADVVLALDCGLGGYWKFDQAGGTSAFDASNNGNTGGFSVTPPTASSTVPPGIKFSDPRSLSFNGSSTYVEAANAPTMNPTTAITVTAWIRTSKASLNYIITKGDNSFKLAVGVGSPGRLSFSLAGVTGWVSGVSTVSDDQWHHVAATWDKVTGLVKLYVDGLAETTATVGGTAINVGASSVQIGSYNYGSNFLGLMDDVRLYNRALTPAEIAELRNGQN